MNEEVAEQVTREPVHAECVIISERSQVVSMGGNSTNDKRFITAVLRLSQLRFKL